MNRKECNCCCFCCFENNKNDWSLGHQKELHKCCCQWEKEKEFSKCDCKEREKDYNKCEYSHGNYLNKNYDYGFDNKFKNENSCDCAKSNYGYEKYDQKNFGWY